jgi:hypothetical protein
MALNNTNSLSYSSEGQKFHIVSPDQKKKLRCCRAAFWGVGWAFLAVFSF